MGLQPNLVTDVAKQIARERGITVSHAYKEARKQQLETRVIVPEGWSKKDYVLEALFRLNSNSGVKPETLMGALKAMDVKTNLNEVIAVCWDLQKQQMVVFKESHAKGGSFITRIRLTPGGRAEIVRRRGTPLQSVGVETSEPPKKAPVQRQKPVEVAPVEIIQPAKPSPEVVPAPAYEAPVAPYVDPNPLNQNLKARLEDFHPLDLRLETYPLLMDLIDRRDRKKVLREKAAKFVEAASLISDLDIEEADRLMTKAGEMEGPSLTKLEMEMLRLLDNLRG